MQYWNITSTKIFLATLFFSITVYTASAQENSPYSRYGIGNTKLTENVASRGMGGVSIADTSATIANPTNPASFASLKLTSFQVGLEGTSTNIRNSSVSNRTGSLVLSYVNIGMPITKHIGVSFGLMPQTRSKFAMQQTDSIANISQVVYNYYGGGGTQKIYLGAAYKFKDYSFGVMTGYMFGNVLNSSDANFTDSIKIVSSSMNSRTNVGGIFLQVGALMNKPVKEKYHITLGANYQLAQNLNAKKDTYWKSFRGDVSSPTYEYSVDSIIESKGKVFIPGKLSVGAMFSNGNLWKAGIDFVTSNWSNYRSYGQADSTSNSWMLKIGGAITPDADAVGKTWKRVTYRIGGYAGQDIFRFNNTNLPVAGATVGIGYPIRRTILSIGQINASLDIGKRGTTKNGLLSEGYTRFSIGFTFNDKWFIPQKYE
ncbi:hypothetical protein EMGBS15_07090 [Filimonas sp.]|nr:hypothetical protein EMGBS15_07090 [Filimonas sp.]